MGFNGCNRDDPFTSRVRTLYRANVLRAPRSGIDPLEVLAVRDRDVETRGRLSGLLAGSPSLPQSQPHPVANLDGLRSAGLSLDLGLKLTAKFLSVIGIPAPGGELTTTLWNSTKSIDFEVRDVSEVKVDLGELGKALVGQTIDASPSTEIFFRDHKVRMLLITRTLVSRHFAIHSSTKTGQSADVSLEAIDNLLGSAKASVTWKQESADTISFQGETPVTFAFGAVPCAIQPNRAFYFGIEQSNITFGDQVPDPKEQPVVDENGLLDIDAPAE